ncbi:MAG: Rpn family recombination-promoting nuclease/putative transposase [Acidobacteriota bacterium]
MSQPTDLYDRNFRQLFANPDFLADLLRAWLPGDWIDHLDWSTLKAHREVHVAPGLRKREADMIWRVAWVDPEGDPQDPASRHDVMIYLLLEFQQKVDPGMAIRMGLYQLLLYQDLRKTGGLRRGRRLPAVLPIVIYNGSGRWTASRNLSALIDDRPAVLRPYRPNVHYLAIDLNELAASGEADNLVTLLSRLERSESYAALRRQIVALAEMLHERQLPDIRRDVADYLRNAVRSERTADEIEDLIQLLEDPSMLRESLARWKKQDIALGRALGEEEGLARGIAIGERRGFEAGRQMLAEVLIELIETRFGDALPGGDLRQRIDDASAEQLRVWSARALRADALEDVFRNA